MYLAGWSRGGGQPPLKPGSKSARGTMGAPFSDRPPVTAPRYVFSPAVTLVGCRLLALYEDFPVKVFEAVERVRRGERLRGDARSNFNRAIIAGTTARKR